MLQPQHTAALLQSSLERVKGTVHLTGRQAHHASAVHAGNAMAPEASQIAHTPGSVHSPESPSLGEEMACLPSQQRDPGMSWPSLLQSSHTTHPPGPTYQAPDRLSDSGNLCAVSREHDALEQQMLQPSSEGSISDGSQSEASFAHACAVAVSAFDQATAAGVRALTRQLPNASLQSMGLSVGVAQLHSVLQPHMTPLMVDCCVASAVLAAAALVLSAAWSAVASTCKTHSGHAASMSHTGSGQVRDVRCVLPCLDAWCRVLVFAMKHSRKCSIPQQQEC